MSRRPRWEVICAIVALSSLAAPVRSQAQPAPTSPAPSPGPPPPGTEPSSTAPEGSTPAQAEARARFNRALELADDADFGAAFLELQRAYQLAPSYRILYNIGLVSQQLKDYARAYDAFERYLKEGGAEVPADRAAEVSKRLERLAGRIAYLTITSSPPGAEVSFDDLVVGTTPFTSPLRISSGQRRVTARLPGRPVETRVLELTGGQRSTVNFDFSVPSQPSSRPRSAVPIIAWSATAALTAGAVTTGILALTSTNHYDTVVNTPGITAQTLDSAWSKAHTFALATDVIGATAIAAAAVSIYFTVRPPRVSDSRAASVVILPGFVSGTF